MSAFIRRRLFVATVAKRLQEQGLDVYLLSPHEKPFNLLALDKDGQTCYVCCSRNFRFDFRDQSRIEEFKAKHPTVTIFIASEGGENQITFAEFVETKEAAKK